VEAWEKVFIDGEAYAADVHAFINCTACHGGQPVGNIAEAHTGLIASPSDDPEATCGTCHPNVAPYAAESLHFTLAGYDTALQARSSDEHFPALDEMQSYHCDSCHASCGDCHVSQPSSVGGGLLKGHTYVRTPPMSRTCTGCHGSRVKNEYFGLNEGIVGDVHLRQAQMACTDCHSADEMHGVGAAGEQTHRYDGAPQPACESCHADQVGIGSGIIMHELHGTEVISCQGCHSVAYTNCTNCHVDKTDENVPFYSIEAHSTQFLLGRNPLRSAERPWRYVPVRHVPVDANSFSAYGENLLDNFLNRPTWTFATPHNIQRNTPQTESCAACHSNDAIFLTPDKVDETERGGANLNVIVEAAPPLPSNLPEFMTEVLERLNQSDPPAGE
jgi:thiosulfate/3-mercaptopyruvate sulfurtransferase